MDSTPVHISNGDDSGMLSHIHVLHPTHTKAPLTLAVPPGAKVADLKTAIAERCPGQPKPNGQRIIWNGRIVVDEEVVGDIWKPGHGAHTVHLAVHPSAWSSPPATEEHVIAPTAPPAPITPGTPLPSLGFFANPQSPFMSALVPTTPLQLPTQASVAKDYVMFHHTNALRVMAGQPLEPWASTWGIDQSTAGYWAYLGITSAGHQFPHVLTAPYPAQSAGEVGLEYSFVNIDGRPYLSLSNPGASPTAMQQHAVTVLTTTLGLIPYLDELTPPPQPPAPIHLTYLDNQIRPAQTRIRRARRLAVAFRTVVPLSFTLLRASLFIVFFPPAREPLWLLVIIGIVCYEARMILNRANDAEPNPQPDGNNANQNANAPNRAANNGNNRSLTLRSVLDHATLTRMDAEAASLDLEVPEREFREAPRDVAEESRVKEALVRARTFLVLFGVTLFPAAWARRREALRLREGKVRVVYGERANLIGRQENAGQGQTLAEQETEQQQQQQQPQEEEVPLGDRRRLGLRMGGWRREYVERVLGGFEEHSGVLPAANDQEATYFESARQSWEDAGARLFTAMSEYLDALSTFNGLFYTYELLELDKKNLVPRIDHHLANFNNLSDISLRLKQLQNRNKAPINTIPSEILAYIFYLVIDQAQPIRMQGNYDHPDIYQRTTALLGVCHHWRRIALMTPSLWSLVTFFMQDCHRTDSLPLLWLERGARGPLNIALYDRQAEPMSIVPTLTSHASRFRTLNISTNSVENTHAIMTCWIDHGAPGSVTELCVSSTKGPYAPLLSPNTRVNHSREELDKFLRPLCTIRLRNFYLEWDSAAYEGLVELWFQTKENIEARHLATALERAGHSLELLVLNQIRLNSPGESMPKPVFLPRLKTMCLIDIEPGSLVPALLLVEPGTHDVHLELSLRCLPSNTIYLNISSLKPTLPHLKHFNISALLLDRRCEPSDLRSLLQSLPRLRTLYISDSGTEFNTAVLNAMTRSSSEQQSIDAGSTTPSLRAIHITGTIRDKAAFKAMVSSHQLEQLTLTAWVKDLDSYYYTHRLRQTDELSVWLSSHISDFVCSELHDKSDYRSRIHPFFWRLW
ncbi:hypothetical protein FRC07_013163 [Ceratobasidium sp. 392]|nr:hypothetical protein FRC07_013163 [Ceratobasidium sp. 392]